MEELTLYIIELQKETDEPKRNRDEKVIDITKFIFVR